MDLKDLNINWPITGADLENWRVMHGLSKPEAAEAFGIPMSKWYAITNSDISAKVNASQVITDRTVVLTLLLYLAYPKSAPIHQPTNITTFYRELGFGDELADRERFSNMIGRSVATVYRMVDKMNMTGSPGRPVQCLVDGVSRLSGTPKQKVQIMEKIADFVKNNHSVPELEEGIKNVRKKKNKEES